MVETKLMPLIDDEMLKENNFLLMPGATEIGGGIFPGSDAGNPGPDVCRFR